MRVESKLRLPPAVYEHLRRHAFERGVSIQELMCSILWAWTAVMTDPDHPAFHPAYMGVDRPGLPPEPHPGYLESIGFAITTTGEIDFEQPQVVARTAEDARSLPFERPDTYPLHANEATWRVGDDDHLPEEDL